MTAADRELLASLLSEVRRLSVLLERRGAPHDPADDAALVLALATAAGGSAFRVMDVLKDATVNPELHTALSDRGLLAPRRLGCVFRRLHGRVCGAFVLRAMKRDERGLLWCVRPADGHQHTDIRSSTTRVLE